MDSLAWGTSLLVVGRDARRVLNDHRVPEKLARNVVRAVVRADPDAQRKAGLRLWFRQDGHRSSWRCEKRQQLSCNVGWSHGPKRCGLPPALH
jgi:hypothetical protein